MIDRQEKILIDIYERSRQGKDSVVLPGCGNLLVDTQEKQILINDLRLLQNEGYINGVLEHPSDIKEGKAFYLLTNIRITPKGIKFCANLTESVYIESNGWLLSYNDYARKDNKIYLVSNANQKNGLISIAQIYNAIESLKRPILQNIIEKREEENFITYIIKKPLIITSEKEQAWNDNLIFGFRFKKNEYWRDEMSQDLKNKFGYEGKNFRTIFQDKVEISCHFKSQLRFIDCIFKDKLSTMKDVLITFSKGVMFESCKFCSKVSFADSKFEADTTFYKSKFNAQVNFQGANFQGNAYFSESIFAENANFSRSVFEKTAVFYGEKFEKTPNFSQAIFKGSLNLVNAKLEFGFEELKEAIQKECQTTTNTKSLAECANDFRDSFRGFKNALIKDNNLLDASNWHKVELYAKEIELDSKKLEKCSKEWIDKWVLKFYRHTSDHHTDLVRIISCVVTSIGLFGILLFGIRYGLDLKSFVANHSNNFCAKLLDSSFIIESNMIGLFYIYATCALFVKEIRFVFYLCVTIYMCAIQYKNIFLIFGNLTHSNANQSAAENLLIVIYAILMFLLIFSLQKTARKNSIIPH